MFTGKVDNHRLF